MWISGLLLAVTLTGAGRWVAPGELRGGGADPSTTGRFFVWGSAVWVSEGKGLREVARGAFGFDDGGCVFDADGDGLSDLILARRSGTGVLGELVFLRAPGFVAERIDTDVELHDCRAATLFGRRGFLMIHRGAQVRFYWLDKGKWAVQEVYSIYTASRQAGMALADVDGDGRVDTFAGNYWIRSPEAFDLPWRIFAIHLHHEDETAASFVYGAWPDLLVGAQRERMGTPVRVFRPGADRKLEWVESGVSGARLDRPRGAAVVGDAVVFGDALGLMVVRAGSFVRVRGRAVVGVWEAGGVVCSVSAREVRRWRVRN